MRGKLCKLVRKRGSITSIAKNAKMAVGGFDVIQQFKWGFIR